MKAAAGEVWVDERGSEMVYVPAGEFGMGSEGGEADERPVRRVYLDGYWIDKRPVTVREYRRFAEATGRKMPPAPEWGWQEDHPIVNETWEEAAAYAAWAGKRLPTEAEWEKAARGTDGREYPWGNEWDAGEMRERPQFWHHPAGGALSGGGESVWRAGHGGERVGVVRGLVRTLSGRARAQPDRAGEGRASGAARWLVRVPGGKHVSGGAAGLRAYGAGGAG